MGDITFAIVGGTLIGIAAVWMLLSLGRVAGISGIAAQALRSPLANSWAVLFILGLGIGGWVATGLGFGSTPVATQALIADLGTPLLIVGGLLVGLGTRLGSGCTSGHGVCGISRLSPRSMVATLTFVAVGMLTATLVHGS